MRRLPTSEPSLSSLSHPQPVERQERANNLFPINQLFSLINTASLIRVPRSTTSCLPSLDHAKSKIFSVLKSVKGFASPLPSSAIVQMFAPPPRESRKATARPSGVKCILELSAVGGSARVFRGDPPSGEIIATLRSMFAFVSVKM